MGLKSHVAGAFTNFPTHRCLNVECAKKPVIVGTVSIIHAIRIPTIWYNYICATNMFACCDVLFWLYVFVRLAVAMIRLGDYSDKIVR